MSNAPSLARDRSPYQCTYALRKDDHHGSSCCTTGGWLAALSIQLICACALRRKDRWFTVLAAHFERPNFGGQWRHGVCLAHRAVHCNPTEYVAPSHSCTQSRMPEPPGELCDDSSVVQHLSIDQPALGISYALQPDYQLPYSGAALQYVG